MDDDRATEILTTLQELFQTNRAFFATYRFMDSTTRDAMMAFNMRNTAGTIALLRMLAATDEPPARRENIIMSIPITFDMSGNFLDPVIVRPTTEQIRAATQVDVPVANETCAICQDSVSVATRIRHCGHCFHANCIGEWFGMNPRCPVCRHDIRDIPAAPPAAEERPDWSWYVNDGSRPVE